MGFGYLPENAYQLWTQQTKHQPPNLPHQLLPTGLSVLGHIQMYRRPNAETESNNAHGQSTESSSLDRFWSPVRIGSEVMAEDLGAPDAAGQDGCSTVLIMLTMLNRTRMVI